MKLLFSFASILLPLSFASAAPADLSRLLAGNYTVANADCFQTGTLKGSSVKITTTDEFVELQGKNVDLEMFEGTKTTTGANGEQIEKSGVVFGNGFAYGETVRNGRNIISKIDYSFGWQDGELSIKRVERIDSRHSQASYCDLAPLRD